MGDTVLYEKQEEVARITLNRPERFNAIDSGMPGDLRRAVERADEDSDVHGRQPRDALEPYSGLPHDEVEHGGFHESLAELYASPV